MLQTVFAELHEARVLLEGIVLKPNMVIDGKNARKASVEEVAEKTLRCLKRTVPAAVPGIAFLSGGQSDEEATARLSAMNAAGNLPWNLTFSYGRALQAAALQHGRVIAQMSRRPARLRAPCAHEWLRCQWRVEAGTGQAA